MPTPSLQPDGEKSPLRELFTVAGPAIVTMLSPAAMQFVDALLVARLGTTAVAAQGNGGMFAFVVMATLMGFLSVINTFAAQNFGAKRFDRCGRYGWTAVWLALGSAVLVLPLIFVVDDFFRLLGHGKGGVAGEQLLRYETEYSVILLAFAVFPTTAARGLGQFFYGIHRPRVVMVSTIVANATNLIASYVLIFGELGFPPLGVAGAAIGTVIGSCVEFGIPMALFLSRDFDAKYRTRAVWRPSLRAMREVAKLGWAAGLHFGNEIACWGLFMAWVVPSAVSPEDAPAAIAGSYIALNWMKLGFLPVVGLSFGVTAVVGARIGRGDPNGASRRAMLGMRIGMLYMILFGAVILLTRTGMTRVFINPDAAAADPELARMTLEIGAKILAMMAIFQAFDAVAIVMGGALRGAGETAWQGMVVVSTAWGIMIFGGLAVGRLFPQFGSVGPWLAAGAYLGISGIALFLRFKAGKWRSRDLLDRDGPDRAVAS
jgi:MATE family multidrug resistance protein